MKRKARLSQYIRIWGTVLIIGVAVSITAIDIVQSYRDFNQRSSQLRDKYIANQKTIIKQEVERVAHLISYEISKSEEVVRQTIKSRTYEAFSISQNIYEQNKSLFSKNEIQKIIVDALRPFRYAEEKGYYFVISMTGSILIADRPEMEEKNLLEIQDTHGKFFIKDTLDMAKISGEGFYEYHWTKPNARGNNHKKISFVKQFEPYQWIIGTGLYVSDIEEKINKELLATISRIRFGKEGYIFVNRLNGDALVSNGKVFSGTKKLWEEFNANPEKMKGIFQQEYDAALKPDGDYIYYSHIKLTTPEKESSKASYIIGIPEKEWLIGAGVYLDDVEENIAAMQSSLNREAVEKICLSFIVSIAIFSFFIILFNRLSRNLKNDTGILISFFQNASFSNETINRDLVHFEELDQMAERANNMLLDKMEAEKALVRSEQRFKDLSENSSDLIWEFDENEIFTYLSPKVKDQLGYWPEELIGKSAFDPMSSEESRKVMKTLLRYKEKRKPFSNLVNVNQHKNGWNVVIESSGIPIFDGNGMFCGYRGINRDITERTKFEEQLRQSHKMEAIGTLAGGIAHDFNNILAVIVGYAELAKLEIPQFHPADQYIDELLTASNRAKEVVHHILSYSRKETGKLTPVLSNEVAEEAVKLLRATIPTSIEIQTEIHADCDPILANPTQLHQIILNLCTNAFQSMEGSNGTLQIKLTQIHLLQDVLITSPEQIQLNSGSYIKLTVSDTGPGIDAHLLNKIFDPYFTTKETGKGSGMGLAVVQGIVKSFDGVIEVESVSGKGSSFHVYFPTLDSKKSRKKRKNKMDQEKPEGNERILLVDDEIDIVFVNQQRLQRLGYGVITSTKADEALDLFRSKPDTFDLIITDQSMPGMTGVQLTHAILELRPDTPIIMCTGYSSQIDKEKAEISGIKDFLIKPVDFNELAISVRKILDAV